MKKIFLFIAVTAAVCITLLSACNRFDTKNVSEFRDQVFEGKTEEYEVTLISGYRENPFVIDGHCDKKADFTLITVKMLSPLPNAELTCEMIAGDKQFEGKMNKHPFEDTYSFEANVRVSEAPVLKINGTEIGLQSVRGEDFIDGEKAYNVAYSKLSDSPIIVNGEYEVYVRLIENPVNSQGGYYWYVAFVDGNYTAAALIDPVTAEVIAQKS